MQCLRKVAVLLLVLPLPAFALVSPLGPEFQVNTYTPNAQDRPAICRDAAGNFVVVWESDNDQDGDQSGIFAQRYNSIGQALGAEFQVADVTLASVRAGCVRNLGFCVGLIAEAGAHGVEVNVSH